VDFLINDLSLHGQFSAAADFLAAVEVLMDIRQAIRRAGRELLCHRGLWNARVTPEVTTPEAVQSMPSDKRRAWTQWLTREGPHWEDSRRHSGDDWLEKGGEPIFTDHAVGEAAFCKAHGFYRETVSLSPSNWLESPIIVIWRREREGIAEIHVVNRWQLATVARALEGLPKPYNSWDSLEEHGRRICDRAVITNDAFQRLRRFPYVQSIATGTALLLDVLNKMSKAFDKEGKPTEEFRQLYDTYFKGKDPYFSDESDTNKREFQSQLTFPNPSNAQQTLFCSWHGKVNSPKNFPPVRIHFTWPIIAKSPPLIVFVGPKITRD
jgi:hypothetical protein